MMESDVEFYSRTFPPPTPKPCDDCPWRRIATRGWLGPMDAHEWIEAAHGESAIACHKTIRRTNDEGVGDWDNPEMRQCRGMSIFRENVFKVPRHPDLEPGPEDRVNVFATNEEFVDYHVGGKRS